MATVINADGLREIVNNGTTGLGLVVKGGSWNTDPLAHEIVLRNCQLQDVSFTGADLQDTLFDNCVFVNCRFDSANLRESRFNSCQFGDPDDDTPCSFKFANLTATEWLDCDLSLANLSRSQLYRASFSRCKMTGINLVQGEAIREMGGLTLSEVSFLDCNLAYADVTGAQLPGADFSASRLSHAVLHGADLTEAILCDCELHGIEADDIILRGADLRGCDVSGIDLREIDLEGTIIEPIQQEMLLTRLGIQVRDR